MRAVPSIQLLNCSAFARSSFYNPNSDYDTAEKEELAEECKNTGDDQVIQERAVIARFLVRS